VSVVVLVVGGRAVALGAMTLGDLAMYAFLVGLLAAPLVQIAVAGGEAGKAIAGLARINALRSVSTEAEEDRDRAPVRSIAGAVELERVSFEYVPGVPVLREVSLFVRAGSTVALVGPSGAGKSTLCRLLLAFERPTHGRVLVDGRDLALLRRGEHRAHLGVVLQDDFLFHGSIADNIRFGRPGAAMEDVRVAGALAHCEEFVEQLAAGYDTIIGERGVRLSGGQRQRVAIARAILADPRILILDEATCHLDAENEALVRDALRVLSRGRTTFVIAHRMTTVRDADQIVVMRDGRVVECGTHEELVRGRGAYWLLVQGERRGEPGAEVRGGGENVTTGMRARCQLNPL
jgi:subfamily B ATP-binding cassette protein MsbA